MLRANLLYHHFLGVDTVYLYDDHSDDGTLESVADLPFVVSRPSVDPSEMSPSPELARAIDQRATQVVARQMLDMTHAMGEARRSGASWLIGFDADELIAVDRIRAQPGALAQLLNAQPVSVEAIIFLPLEAVQRRLSYAEMAEETLFKRPDSGATRDTYDPFQKRVQRIRVVYGHRWGKMAVRVGVDAYPRSTHRWAKRGSSDLRAGTAGDLLHYYASDFESFVRKFRIMKDHPDRHVSGREVVLQKRLWRDVVNRAGFSDDELRDYYARWVMFDDKQLSALTGARRMLFGRRRPVLAEVTSARDAIVALRDARR
jgi:hypothetical protein